MGGFTVDERIAYAVAGQDFKLISQRIKGSGATMVMFIGEPSNLGLLLKALKEDGVDIPVFGEANLYDDQTLSQGANPLGEVLVRIPYPMFEESDDHPALAKFLEIMDARKAKDSQTKVAALGIQSTSAWLLFATAAQACGTTGDSVISRDCIRTEIEKIGEWTGGGLHAPTNPGKGLPAKCEIVVSVDGDSFARRFPELGSEDADAEGYFCPDDAIVDVNLD